LNGLVPEYSEECLKATENIAIDDRHKGMIA